MATTHHLDSHTLPAIRRLLNERGVIAAVSLLISFSIGGLMAIEASVFNHHVWQMTQNSRTETAALAAVKALHGESGTQTTAVEHAEQVLGHPLRADSIHSAALSFGNYNKVTGTFSSSTSCAKGCNAVRLELHGPYTPLLQGIFSSAGGSRSNSVIQSSAVAYYDAAAGSAGMDPFRLAK